MDNTDVLLHTKATKSMESVASPRGGSIRREVASGKSCGECRQMPLDSGQVTSQLDNLRDEAPPELAELGRPSACVGRCSAARSRRRLSLERMMARAAPVAKPRAAPAPTGKGTRRAAGGSPPPGGREAGPPPHSSHTRPPWAAPRVLSLCQLGISLGSGGSEKSARKSGNCGRMSPPPLAELWTQSHSCRWVRGRGAVAAPPPLSPAALKELSSLEPMWRPNAPKHPPS